MEITLTPVKKHDKAKFVADLQAAFQYGYERIYGPYDKTILPENEIEESFCAKGAEAYFAVADEKIVGGTIVVIDSKTHMNHLDLLYVNTSAQNGGIGEAIWHELEKRYPKTKVWETFTPYFDKRNIHFYVNKLGFNIVEFFSEKHKDPQQSNGPAGGMPEETGYDFFRFEKIMSSD